MSKNVSLFYVLNIGQTLVKEISIFCPNFVNKIYGHRFQNYCSTFVNNLSMSISKIPTKVLSVQAAEGGVALHPQLIPES